MAPTRLVVALATAASVFFPGGVLGQDVCDESSREACSFAADEGGSAIQLLQSELHVTKRSFEVDAAATTMGSEGEASGSTKKVLHLAGSTDVPSSKGLQFFGVQTQDSRTSVPYLGAPGRVANNIAPGVEFKGWKWRLEQYIGALEKEAETNPSGYVVFTDVGDVVNGGCTDEMFMEAYHLAVSATPEASVIFAAEHRFGPGNHVSDQDDIDEYESFRDRQHAAFVAAGLRKDAYEEVVKPAPDCEVGWTPLFYLNMGIVMGPVADLLEVFKGMHALGWSEAYGFSTFTPQWDDQMAAHHFLLNNKDKVTLDYTGQLFFNTYEVNGPMREILEVSNGMLRNQVTGKVQCLVHFAGNQNPGCGLSGLINQTVDELAASL